MSAPDSRRIRVLLVDDNVTVRQLLTEAFSTVPDIEVVGTAPNGALALALLPRVAPDVIVLDIDMPVMNGLDFLTRLRPLYPRLPVIVFSTFTTHGAETTLQALWLGASDYVAKPQAGAFRAAVQAAREELLPRIRAFAPAVAPTHAPTPPPSGSPFRFLASPPRHAPAPRRPARAGLIAIGASTGGPRALARVLQDLPRDFPAPVVIVQHMPPVFTRHLADGLSSQCDLRVREAEDGAVLEAGTVWVAPGDHHMTLVRMGAIVSVRLDQDAPENSCRPSVNPTFRSAAAAYGGATLAVILTGMGQDGLEGARAVRESGGQVIAQDEATSVVWGMPGVVARAGLADQILPLDSIAAAILAHAAPSGGRHAA